MVAHNPLFHGRWTWKKFGATVLDDIWVEVIFFTLIGAMVTLVSELTSVNLGVNNQLLTVLGLVLGLVISFRTSSAYERYQDGRKMWTNITVASRNLAQMFWVHVPVERSTPSDPKDQQTELQNVIEKKTMIGLVQAFSVSVKHLLRGEPGPYYQDLYPLISFLPRYANAPASEHVGPESERLPLWYLRDEHEHLLNNPQAQPIMIIPEVEPKLTSSPPGSPEPHKPNGGTETPPRRPTHDREKTLINALNSPSTSGRSTPVTLRRESHRIRPLYAPIRRTDTFDPEAVLPQVPSEVPLRPARDPPQSTIYHYIPLLRFLRWIWRRVILMKPKEEERRKRRKAYADIVESHIPLEISLVLHSYLSFLMKRSLIQPAIATAITNNLVLFQDTVANLERICNTPLPFAYQAHLRMSLWIYLALLPFQIYTLMKWITIPATAFASFLLLGFLEIGQEIENPFNYDYNDLDLDHFCLSIQRDLHEVTAHTISEPSSFIFTKWNQPFAPTDGRTAQDLTRDRSVPYTCPDSIASLDVDPGMVSVRRTLVNGWKTVDVTTREK